MTQIPTIQGTTGFGRLDPLTSVGRPRPPQGHGGKPPISREEMDEKFRTAAAAQGIDVEKLDSLKDTIRDKVQSTVQDGGSATDVLAAIDQVLKDNGIDPDQLHEQMQAAAGSLGAPPGPPPDQGSQGQSVDPALMMGNSALFGLDLNRLFAGENTGLSVYRQA